MMTPKRPENLTDAEKAAWLEGPEGRRLLDEAEWRPIHFERKPPPASLAEWLALLDETDRRIFEAVAYGAPCREVAEHLGGGVTVEQVKERVRDLGERLDALFGRSPMSPEARRMRMALAAAA
ncbi:MAG: hypothetical protein FJX74_20255 [Armatimonadetes bacterium]|nr:hypothetical protein [Armatimonadota bacterium]